MTARHRRALAVAAVLLGAGALLALLAAGHVLGFLYLAPALLLGAVLALGRFPGERALAARLAAPTPRRLPLRSLRRRGAVVSVPRGGLLLARRLAGRAPPRWIGTAA